MCSVTLAAIAGLRVHHTAAGPNDDRHLAGTAGMGEYAGWGQRRATRVGAEVPGGYPREAPDTAPNGNSPAPCPALG
jgi:hypothetical protein